MTELSLNARVVLGSSFGFGQVLTYHMIESIPSDEMQAALDELVGDGKLVREMGMEDMPAHGKAVRYRVAENVDLAPFKREVWERMQSDTLPGIRVYVPRKVAADVMV